MTGRTKLLLAGLAMVVGVAAAGAAVVFGGLYNVGATTGHAKPLELVLRKTMESSVERQARSIARPDDIDVHDRAYAARFFGHYDAACASCHGAPGRDPDPWMVIYPSSPLLTDPAVVGRWSDEQLFWILKHGIKDTGMMALGPTHSDADIWGVTAFVRQLPRMTPTEYAALAAYQQQLQTEAAADHH
jgi:mono/diheme cytochrome c family protein